MNRLRRYQALAVALGLIVTLNPLSSRAAEPDVKAKLRPWTSGLAAGMAAAQRDGMPALVRVEAEFCPWCKTLEKEIAAPEVQAELGRWTLVTVDAEDSPDEAKQLRVTGYPALRLLTTRGTLVAAKDGFLPAAQLVAWLTAKYDEAAAPVDDALVAEGEPAAIDVMRLVRVFKQPEAAQREAAIRRLKPYPQAAALAVASAFREGNLSMRLASLELLRPWGAPTDGLDPWRPETIGKEQLAALDDWGAKAATTPPQLEPDALSGARADLTRLLAAPAAGLDPILERLARFGPRLLAEVRQELKQAETDDARQRLTMLRYRLAASDALALNWPGGIGRLASAIAEERHRAADELVRRATARDETLLVELFSDPDPLVREISLRGLKSISEDQGGALVNLLGDPDPNVRAAVLKELAESPPAALASKVAAYLTQEQDSDLVVHGIRALREMKTKSATAALVKLLAHESWQVRAEAAEGVGSILAEQQRSHYDQAKPSEENVEHYLALIELLADSDSFVVSRALQAVSDSHLDLPEAVPPILKAIADHPEIAPKAIELLVARDGMRNKASKQLHEFLKHERAEVRAAALTGLAAADEDETEGILSAGLVDADVRVRIAAAKSLETQLESIRRTNAIDPSFSAAPESSEPSSGGLISALGRGLARLWNNPVATKSDELKPITEPEPVAAPVDKPVAKTTRPDGDEEKAEATQVDPDAPTEFDEWLIAFRSGRGRPEWTAALVTPLLRMLESTNAEESLAAALCLVPLGKYEQAQAVLLKTLKATPHMVSRGAEILPWLPWKERLAMYHKLESVAPAEERLRLIHALVESPDRRAAEPLWTLLAGESADGRMAETVRHSLPRAYFGQNYYDRESQTPSDRKRALGDALAHIDQRRRWQTLVALELAAGINLDKALVAADKLYQAMETPASLRADALQILLLGEENPEAVKLALAALDGADPKLSKLALMYLAGGRDWVKKLPDENLSLSIDKETSHSFSSSADQAVQIDAPRGLTAAQLEPQTKQNDRETAALAHYLLVLLEEPDHLDPLIAYWRSERRDSAPWRVLVYRAIAFENDAAKLSVLQEIYSRLPQHDIRDFYWTIRNMDGPEALRFRKRIRQEVGMEQLR